MAKLTLDLHVFERDALFKLAERARRKPKDMAAVIIREGLEQRGLLTPLDSKNIRPDAICNHPCWGCRDVIEDSGVCGDCHKNIDWRNG